MADAAATTNPPEAQPYKPGSWELLYNKLTEEIAVIREIFKKARLEDEQSCRDHFVRARLLMEIANETKPPMRTRDDNLEWRLMERFLGLLVPQVIDLLTTSPYNVAPLGGATLIECLANLDRRFERAHG